MGSDGAKPRQVWDPRSGALVSAGMSGWEHEEGAGETLAGRGLGTGATLSARGQPHLSCHLLQPGAAPITQAPPTPQGPGPRAGCPHATNTVPQPPRQGGNPKWGAVRSHGNPTRQWTVPGHPVTPHPCTAALSPACPYAPHPSTMSQTPQSHQRTPLEHSTWPPGPGSPMPQHHLGPKPHGSAHGSGCHGPLCAHIALATRLHPCCRPSRVTNFIFWEILHFKAVVLVWMSAGTALPVPSLPRLLVSMQGSVGYFYYYFKKKKENNNN